MVIFHCMTRPQWMHAFLCWWTLGFFFPLFYFEAFNLMRSEFLDFSTVDTWGWVILHGGDCLVHCGMFSGIPGLPPPPPRDASSTLPPKTHLRNQKHSRHCQASSGGQNHPTAEREPRDWKMYDWRPQWLHQFICSPATHGVPGSPYFCQLSLGQTAERLCPSGGNKMASRLHFRSYFPSCWCGWGSFQRCFGLSRLLLCGMSVSFAHFFLLSCFFCFSLLIFRD